MAGISNFTLTWWYTPDTKLAISFQTIGGSLTTGPTFQTLDSLTGLSASVEENYRFESQITSHPVEAGLAVSDYIIVQPKIISIQGLLTAIDTIPVVGTGILNFNQLGEGVQFLFQAAQSRQLFTLVTGLYFGRGFYRANNLAIQSLDVPRNFQYGRTSIRFNIVFKEIIITDTNSPKTNSSTQGALDPSDGGIT